ncbi:hypothetical protein Patl1_32330 [Pistacia atlantica]|uniref:Uncharacterized protein n=1 Tax=Pistacia atlantica TaxID=434234 RepID=A0ACC1ARD7_9ROSI|nr:hypothetical protein Patl1_32330 [Pistacia atlantica]
MQKICARCSYFKRLLFATPTWLESPAVVTRCVDCMTDNLRRTCAKATGVANAVLDGTLSYFFIHAGSDAILLGAETARQSLIVRSLFPMLADPRHPVPFMIINERSLIYTIIFPFCFLLYIWRVCSCLPVLVVSSLDHHSQ